MNRLRSHGVPLDRLYVVYLKGYTKFYTVLMMLLLNGSFVLWEGLRELCVPRLNNMVLNMKAQLSAIFLCTLVFNLGLFDRNYAVSVEQQLEPTRLCNASARKKNTGLLIITSISSQNTAYYWATSCYCLSLLLITCILDNNNNNLTDHKS